MISYSKKVEKIVRENAFDDEKKRPRLKFNPGLALMGLRTTGPRSLYKFRGKLALFMRFGTFYMTKAKQDMMNCLF